MSSSRIPTTQVARCPPVTVTVTVDAMPEPIYTSAENRSKIATSPDVQLAMVAMDAYDDNGPTISRVLMQMNLPPQVA
ncbi:hypothetical protein BCEP27_11433 [Burkholderia cepacia]